MSRAVPSPAERSYRRLVRRLDRVMRSRRRGRFGILAAPFRFKAAALREPLGWRLYVLRGGARHRALPRRG